MPSFQLPPPALVVLLLHPGCGCSEIITTLDLAGFSYFRHDFIAHVDVLLGKQTTNYSASTFYSGGFS